MFPQSNRSHQASIAQSQHGLSNSSRAALIQEGFSKLQLDLAQNHVSFRPHSLVQSSAEKIRQLQQAQR